MSSLTPTTQRFATHIAADRRQICAHTGSCGGIEPGLAIFRTKYGVNDNFAKRLCHGVDNGRKGVGMNRAFSAGFDIVRIPGAVPQAKMITGLWR